MIPSSSKTEVTRHTCQICSESFPSLGSLKRHLHSHVRSCNSSYNAREQISVKRERDKQCKKVYPCETCNNVYKNLVSLRQHTKCHSGIQVFECITCHLAYDTHSKLQQHIGLYHDIDRKYECLYCHSVFPLKTSVKEHLKVHVKVRPTKCNICNEGIRNESKVHKQHFSLYHPGEEISCSANPEFQEFFSQWTRYVSITEQYLNAFDKNDTVEKRTEFEAIKKMVEECNEKQIPNGKKSKLEESQKRDKKSRMRHNSSGINEMGHALKKQSNEDEVDSNIVSTTGILSKRQSCRLLGKKINLKTNDITGTRSAEDDNDSVDQSITDVIGNKTNAICSVGDNIAEGATMLQNHDLKLTENTIADPHDKHPLRFDGTFHFCFDCRSRFIYKENLIKHLQSSCHKKCLATGEDIKGNYSTKAVKLCDKCGYEYIKRNKHSCVSSGINPGMKEINSKENEIKNWDGDRSSVQNVNSCAGDDNTINTLSAAEIEHVKDVWNQSSGKYKKNQVCKKRRPEYRYDFAQQPDGDLTCDLCDFHCKMKEGLVKHMRQAHFHERFKCKTCNKTFKYRYEMRYHERIHTGEMPWMCPACGAEFAGKSNLNTHLKKHHPGATIPTPQQAVRSWSNPLDGLNATVHLNPGVNKDECVTATLEQDVSSIKLEKLIDESQEQNTAEASNQTSNTALAAMHSPITKRRKQSKPVKRKASPKKSITNPAPFQDKASLDSVVKVAPETQQYVIFRSEDDNKIFVYSDQPLEAAKNIKSILLQALPLTTTNKDAGLSVQFKDGGMADQVVTVETTVEHSEGDGSLPVQEAEGDTAVQQAEGDTAVQQTEGDTAVKLEVVETAVEDEDNTMLAVSDEWLEEYMNVTTGDHLANREVPPTPELGDWPQIETEGAVVYAGQAVETNQELETENQASEDHLSPDSSHNGEMVTADQHEAASLLEQFSTFATSRPQVSPLQDGPKVKTLLNASSLEDELATAVQVGDYLSDHECQLHTPSKPHMDCDENLPSPDDKLTVNSQSEGVGNALGVKEEMSEDSKSTKLGTTQKKYFDASKKYSEIKLKQLRQLAVNDETVASLVEDLENTDVNSRERLYICNVCLKAGVVKVSVYHSMRQHVVIYHCGTLECQLCSKSFKSQYYLKLHVQTQHGGVKFKCPICQKCFCTATYLRKHEAQHAGKFVCNICKAVFTNNTELRFHHKMRHSGKLIKCIYCNKTFKSLRQLSNHKKILHSTRIVNKQLGMTDSPDLILSQYRASLPENCTLFHCPLCTAMNRLTPFPDFEQVEQHVRMVHMIVKYDCKLCGSKYSLKRTLHKHMKQCNGRRRKGNLIEVNSIEEIDEILSEYKKYHSGLEVFNCPLCVQGDRRSRRFSRLRLVRKHMKEIHMAANYICEVCGLTSRTSFALKLHIKERHSKSLICVTCNMSFPSLHMLRKHRKTHATYTECTLCGLKYIKTHKCRNLAVKTSSRRLNQNANAQLYIDKEESEIILATIEDSKHTEFQCPICLKVLEKSPVFQTCNGIKYHLTHVHTRTELICEVCGTIFHSKEKLKRHVNQKHREQVLECLTCDLKFSDETEMDEHLATHVVMIGDQNPEEVENILSAYRKLLTESWTLLECPICIDQERPTNIKYPSFHRLRGHINLVHMASRFACNVCKGTFRKKCDLKQHVRIGHSQKCEDCNDKFPNQVQFKRHMEVKPMLLSCEICGHGCQSECSLTVHNITIHGGSAQVRCDVCNILLYSKFAMRRHNQTRRHLNKLQKATAQQTDNQTDQSNCSADQSDCSANQSDCSADQSIWLSSEDDLQVEHDQIFEESLEAQVGERSDNLCGARIKIEKADPVKTECDTIDSLQPAPKKTPQWNFFVSQ